MPLLNVKDEQFSLDKSGNILFQEKHGSPLPGQPVGVIRKGSHILKPVAEMTPTQSHDIPQDRLQTWLENHLATVLEPLFFEEKLEKQEEDSSAKSCEAAEKPQSAKAVETSETPESTQTPQTEIPEDKKEEKKIAPISGPAREIANRVYEALGILPRAAVQDFIDQLDQEARAALRARRIRLGPILVFIPALNKPAAVNLRAILWAIYHDKTLPVEMPGDGVVSCRVEPDNIDPNFYRSIGYPVYGKRAIRIDMLDRVIVAVYDSAEKGKFQAQHQMAEWLGTPIADLYEILEAMGHKKIYDPADEMKENESDNSDTTEKALKPETSPETEAGDQKSDAPETAEEQKEPEKQEQQRPELATFRLKRGKANEKAESRNPRQGNLDQKKEDAHTGNKKSGKKKGRNPKGKDYKKTMMSAGPKPKVEDSPFAILEQLKGKS